ncbi:LacI family DNA-binding transcriptional regulator [Paenibacillus thermotolerans]|uniref:LacI family DNA-binding transcriptional regulator n=1 Tax=Paenibacillus thermotolerans TaxID=3027807 RepID=UPI002367DB45|nr:MULTISPECIES: LacI family DNA-binding transcriptional regulator [unclassified Paenibacillus]
MSKKLNKSTIKQIAEFTGYSVSTVSLALNQKGSLSEQTRAKILAAAEKLQYIPPVNNDVQFIRLLIEESSESVFADPFNGAIIRAIEQECRGLGYELVLTFVSEKNNPDAWTVGASGLLLLGSGLITDELLLKLKKSPVPVILVDNYLHCGGFISIYADHYGAGYIATQYLIEQGHRSIGFISGPSKYKTLTDRFAGYCSALIEHGIPLNMEFISPNFDKQEKKGYLEMKHLLNRPERPTAVFACSDKAALGAYKALDEMGLKAGEDIELVGCDNIESLRNLPVPIATVDIPKSQVGKQAVRTLLEAINGNDYIRKIVIPPSLVFHG